MQGKSLTEGKPWKLILLFALPLMAGSLLQQLYSTADTIIVGLYDGEAALSAVGTCSSLTMFFLAIAQGFSIGAGIITARLYGAKNLDDLRSKAYTAIVLLLIMGAASMAIGLIFSRFILSDILAVPESLLDMAATYFWIYSLGMVFQF